MNTRRYYAADAATLRKTLTEHGIKQPMWQGFHWTAKMGEHIRQTKLGDVTFELRIWAEGNGYGWSFARL